MKDEESSERAIQAPSFIPQPPQAPLPPATGIVRKGIWRREDFVNSVLLAADGTHWVWTLLGLLSVPALVVLNGLFVAAEFSLVAVRRTRIEELKNQGVAGAGSVMHAIRHLDRS